MITEDQLEQLCLDWFKETGYEYAYGLDIAPDGWPVMVSWLVPTKR